MKTEPAADTAAWLEAARLLLLEPGADADRLYTHWYHRQTQVTQGWPGAGAFRAAVLGANGFEPGWQSVRPFDALAGGVVAMRGGRERLVAPPEMAPMAATGLAPYRGTRLLVHPLASGEVGGFWHLWSAGWQREAPRRLQRIYIGVACERALDLAHLVSRLAPPRPTWAFKILCGPHEAGRRDRAILYLPQDAALDTAWVAAIAAKGRPWFDDDLPPFVQRWQAGTGIACDPGGGRSFGQALCAAVASAAALADAPAAFAPAALAAIAAIPAQAVDCIAPSQALPTLPSAPILASPAAAREGQDRVAGWRASALALARELAGEAVWADGLCAFHGATSPQSLDQPPRFRSLGGDVYEGSAGIARFLGHAAALAGDAALEAAALGAIRHALARVDGWSLFSGGMGSGLVALELAQLLQRPDLVPQAVQAIESAGAAAAADGAPHDMLAGTAGVIIGLVAARRYDLDGGWRARALELGQGLLAASVDEGVSGDDGPPLSWRLGSGIDARLCGLAHGASGVALALESLALIAPDNDIWPRTARRARAYERAHYAADVGSWADLRPREDAARHAPGYPHMWCHGSIGIAAERLTASLGDVLSRADAVGGLAGARAHAQRLLLGPLGPGAGDEINASQCHGVAGLVDLFIDTWRTTGDTAWMALAGELGDLMCNDARRLGGWRSGVPGGWPAPGLMLGKAGAGWALLRLAEPESLPSAWRLGQHLSAAT